MSNIIDLTEQPEPADIGPQRRPRYKHRDHVAMVAAARGPGAHYYDEYKFTGRTFRKRDVLTNPPHDL
jgi:hypothetical protein